MIKIYNTLTGKKERLPKDAQGKVRLFVCGPTVYDYAHIGHARTYMVFDAFVRFLRSQKVAVTYAQNITNVDDKILRRAAEEKSDPLELSAAFEKAYLEDMRALAVVSVNRYARATDHMKSIISQVARLVKKGLAYETESGVYFDVRKFKDYGKLSRQDLAALRSGYRVEVDPQKKDPLDFALWKKVTPEEASAKDALSWASPWGRGRPGWHIEDTAISEDVFGLTYELHGGGVDLKFPHHEAEIAQARALSGQKNFVKVWMHTGFLTIEGEKMSKSLNNFITIRDYLRRHSANSLRLLVLSRHYRSPFDYSEAVGKESEDVFTNLVKFLAKVARTAKNARTPEAKKKSDAPDTFASTTPVAAMKKSFDAALSDDFNTPVALAAVFELVNACQKHVFTMSPESAKKIYEAILDTLKILGFSVEFPQIPESIMEVVENREHYRAKQDWVAADRVRKQLSTLGYVIEDTPTGPFVWPEAMM